MVCIETILDRDRLDKQPTNTWRRRSTLRCLSLQGPIVQGCIVHVPGKGGDQLSLSVLWNTMEKEDASY